MGGGRRKRTLSPEERDLWRTAMRDAKPLHSDAPKTVPEPKQDRPIIAARESGSGSARNDRPGPPASPVSTHPDPPPRRPLFAEPSSPGNRRGEPLPGLDRRTAQRLRRGTLGIEARIDLHGMTQAQAHATLNGFIQRCWADGRRAVLVITGKGGRRPDESAPWRESRGVLQDRVPVWLTQSPNREIVLSVTRAQPRDGGDGALYILLRRKRN